MARDEKMIKTRKEVHSISRYPVKIQAYKIYFNSGMKCNIDINSGPETKFSDRNYGLMMPKYEATQYLVLQILQHLEPSGGLILVSHFNFLDSTSRMF